MLVCLSKNLKKLLLERNLTASELSRLAEVPTSTISNWLSGQPPRNITQVYQVACFFNVSIESLVFGIEANPTKKSPLEHYDSEIKAGFFEVVLRRSK
jgi:transcriptional regulator with XRE-family HTH domain